MRAVEVNHTAASTYLITGLPLAFTALFFPEWWQSPAYGKVGIPLWLQGFFWLFSSLVMVALLAGKAVRPSVAVAGLGCYTVPTFLNGVSIVWFTLESNAVSAIGSAIMWLGFAFAGASRAWLISRLGKYSQEEVSGN